MMLVWDLFYICDVLIMICEESVGLINLSFLKFLAFSIDIYLRNNIQIFRRFATIKWKKSRISQLL